MFMFGSLEQLKDLQYKQINKKTDREPTLTLK